MKTGFSKISIYTIIVTLLLLVSCNDFLDTLPDNRTMLDSPKKIEQLLVTAYPTANISVIAELSSDNFVDNNSPEVNSSNQIESLERMHDEVFAWQPVMSSSSTDSPFLIWQEYYKTIATANHALEAIEKLEKDDPGLDLSAHRGEALLCRAYGHFILVNIFSQAFKDKTASRNDLGIPYVTEPETNVFVDYERISVAEVYEKIAADIEAGIELVNDDYYKVPRYHFNTQAAHAFAARFYLYKRDYEKVVYHANRVLGNNPLAVLRDWTTNYNNSDEEAYAYISATEPANLLILPTYSLFFRTFFQTRYAFNGSAMRAISGGGPVWNGWPPNFSGGWWWTYGMEFGVFSSKVSEMFEYTDKIAGIGFTHVVRTEFTTDETLLCRAEALLFLGRKAEAIADLNTWCTSHQMSVALTEERIRSFYTPERAHIVKPLNSHRMSSSFVVAPDIEPIVQCILHFRRIETIFEGLRWFDIKRYGIEINRRIGRNTSDLLEWNDYRRAIQIPQDVVAAGMKPNPGRAIPRNNLEAMPVER